MPKRLVVVLVASMLMFLVGSFVWFKKLETCGTQLAEFWHMRDYMARNNLYQGLFSEIGLLPALYAWYPRKFVYVDVGANVGQSSALVLHLWGRPTLQYLETQWEFDPTNTPEVYAMDISPANVRALWKLSEKLPAELRSHFHVIPGGMSDLSKTVCVKGSLQSGDQLSQIVGPTSSMTPQCGPDEYYSTVSSFEVFFNSYELPYASVVKIDTEGHEPLVLRGMHKHLTLQKIDVLVFEYNDLGAWKQTSLQATVESLDKYGYDSYMLGDYGVFNLNGGCWHENYEIRAWSNVVAFRRGQDMYWVPTVLQEYPRWACREVPGLQRKPDPRLCLRPNRRRFW